jgi:F0F1-type ATP synthase delta subunit
VAETNDKFTLPESLISPSDLSKAIRELENIDDFLRQAKARAPGNPVTLPKTSQVLTDISETNKISLLDETQRNQLREKLNLLLDNPAKIHISFAATPSASFLRDIVAWLRQNVHRSAMVEVGLQPSIAAGCIVRTKNKVFDLSLRKRFTMNRQMLSAALEKTNE